MGFATLNPSYECYECGVSTPRDSMRLRRSLR